MDNPPRFLYRYYGNKEYLLDVLTNRRLYHCRPSEFNDPFDCQPLISIKAGIGGNDTWRKFLFCWATMGNVLDKSGKSDSELWSVAEQALEKGIQKNQSWVDEFVIGQLRSLADLIRVCCFTKSPRNMMMWAHYANNHQGAVLIFRSSQLRDNASREFRGQAVAYDTQPLSLELYVDALDKSFSHQDPWPMANIIYARKSKDWLVEKEVRFFSTVGRPFLAFNESALYGVIVGARSSECFVRAVRRGIAHWRVKPLLFRTSLEKSVHRLWIERCGG